MDSFVSLFSVYFKKNLILQTANKVVFFFFFKFDSSTRLANNKPFTLNVLVIIKQHCATFSVNQLVYIAFLQPINYML